MSRALLLVTIGNVASAAAQWYLIWLFAQQDGAHAVGQYSTLVAVLTPIFVSTQLGLRNLFITLQTNVRWGVYVSVRSATTLIALVITVFFLWMAREVVNPQFAGALLLTKVPDSIADLYSGRLLRAERLSLLGTISIVSAVVSSLIATVLVLSFDSATIALWGSASVALTSACVLIWHGGRAPHARPNRESGWGGTPSQFRLRQMKAEVSTLVRAGIPMSLMQGIYSLISYIPLAVVGYFGSTEDVGRYASAAYLVVFANLVGASVQTVQLPSYRRLYDGPGQSAVVRRAIRHGCMVMIGLTPLVALALAIGPWLLQTVYGPELLLSRSAVGFLSAAAVLTVPTYSMSTTLLVLNRYWATTAVGASSIVLVLGIGWIAGTAGAEPVEAGTLALLASSVGRLAGEFFFARVPQAPQISEIHVAQLAPIERTPPSIAPSAQTE